MINLQRLELPMSWRKKNTVDSRYLEFKGTFWNTSRYPYFDISDLQNRGKTNSINHMEQIYV